jgi:phosphoglycolate phosphatase
VAGLARAEVLLFDLDGTLSDSAPGILAALRQAFTDVGAPPLDDATGRQLLGPPFHQSLPTLLGDPGLVDEVIARYRAHYGAGLMFDTTVYDGVTDVLAAAHRRGTRLAVATSKPEPYAVPIVERLGLLDLFETVCGDDLHGGRGTKALVVGEALRRMAVTDPARVVMIGDRSHDVAGAHAHGIACIGAAWGYAAPGELETAGADVVCGSPAELGSLLGLDADRSTGERGVRRA